ncbi:hypothetical protein AVEN_248465-1 [Araneus ventricosus]|uniref:DUF4817 domain-containing protein n=1 Tax=Araneus ventricosus TaxID=182803 RepID=A0A4Y2T6D0_ARAVE|nr:hypothetical protein AVEN_248465-1 [Araneus ventricosus]
MPFTKDERIYIILLAGSGATHHVALTFDATHRKLIIRENVAKFMMQFKRTGSVANASRSGKPKTGTDEGTSTQVLAAMARESDKRKPTSLGRNGNHPKQCQQLTSNTHTSCRCNI